MTAQGVHNEVSIYYTLAREHMEWKYTMARQRERQPHTDIMKGLQTLG